MDIETTYVRTGASQHAGRLGPIANAVKVKRDPPAHPEQPLGVFVNPRVLSSDPIDVHGFGPLLALDELIVDHLTFLEGFVAVSVDAGVMDKDILSLILRDEAEPSAIVEPLYLSTGHNLSFRELAPEAQ